jgi:hypothetical protein
VKVPSETTAAAPAETLTSEYEELRRVALGESGGLHGGVGFALLLRRGMAAWMDACLKAALPSRAQSVPRRDSCAVPPELRGEVAQVLAAMALGSRIEGGMTA